MRNSAIYIVKFLGIFSLLYIGTLAVIGMSSPGGTFYNEWIARNLDYVSWIKLTLVHVPSFILRLFGIASHQEPGFILRIDGGRGVFIAYSCVGYGVYSFWIAYVVANKGSFLKKMKWAAAGVLGLWFINVIRITLFLQAINMNWPMPLGIDHHTWFNIFAYLLIFILIILYDKSLRKEAVNDNVLKYPPLEQQKV